MLEFVMPNLKLFNNRLKPVLSVKPLDFVFLCFELTKKNLVVENWCEMFLLKLSGIQIWLCDFTQF